MGEIAVALENALSLLVADRETTRQAALEVAAEAGYTDRIEAGLYLNHDGTFSSTPQTDTMPVGRISAADIGGLFATRFNDGLTRAELDLVMALLAGLTLRQDSQQSGVAYETRRKQMKSVLDKSGLPRQGMLLMMMTTLISTWIHGRRAPPKKGEALIHARLDRFYPEGLRVHELQMSSGRSLTVIDIGPAGGRPVLYMHGGFVPGFPEAGGADVLWKMNARVLIPVRPGFFKVSLKPVDQFVDDVIEFERVFGIADAPLMSQAAGGFYALQRLQRDFDSDRRVVISSLQYRGPDAPEDARRHHRGLTALARQSPHLVAGTLRALLPLVGTLRGSKALYHRMYSNSPADLIRIEDPAHVARVRDYLLNVAVFNIPGIASDYAMSLEDWTRWLPEALPNATFLFGADDPFSCHDLTAPRLRRRGAKVIVRTGHGQNSILSEGASFLGHALGEVK